jgi:predicted ATPase
MFIVAGPPGGGKSSLFSLSDYADQVFNAQTSAEISQGGVQQRRDAGAHRLTAPFR